MAVLQRDKGMGLLMVRVVLQSCLLFCGQCLEENKKVWRGGRQNRLVIQVLEKIVDL